MKNFFQDAPSLWCFSPLVMLVTWNIEWLLAIYIVVRFGKTTVGKLATATLFLLGLFQLSEYVICTIASPAYWMLPGLIAITFLPPLGLHILSVVGGQPKKAWLGYLLATAFSLTYILVPQTFGGAVCTGNYVILDIIPPLGFAYGLYYFGLLFLGIWQAVIAQRTMSSQAERVRLRWLVIGYGSFMLPMAIVYALLPAARAAVPSIMCGFALIFALILAVKIAPTEITTQKTVD